MQNLKVLLREEAALDYVVLDILSITSRCKTSGFCCDKMRAGLCRIRQTVYKGMKDYQIKDYLS